MTLFFNLAMQVDHAEPDLAGVQKLIFQRLWLRSSCGDTLQANQCRLGILVLEVNCECSPEQQRFVGDQDTAQFSSVNYVI